MKALRRLWSRLTGVLVRGHREVDLSDELQSHIDMQTDDNLRAGMSPSEARRQAHLKFGGVELTKEEYRDSRGLPMLETLVRDVRYGFRTLARSPGFTAVAILTLALGIGANTAIFTVANAVLFRPLPFPEPHRLIRIAEEIPRTDSDASQRYLPSMNYLRERDQISTFGGISGFLLYAYRLTGVEDPERLYAGMTTDEFFPLLGVDPFLGRLPSAKDLAEKARVVVLSHGLWRRQFGGDPEIIGDAIELNQESFTVIGVLPANFRFAWKETYLQLDLWAPLSVHPLVDSQNENARWRPVFMFGRLRDEVSLEQAWSELEVLRRRIHPPNRTRQPRTLVLRTLQEDLVQGVRHGIVILLAAVGCVLLIACVNLTNLLLTRGLGRRTEMAVRSALGAGRRRIAQQVITESVLVALMGGALGMLMAYWGVEGLLTITFWQIPRVNDIVIDTDIALYAFLLSLLTGLLFGALPALRSSRFSLSESLKQGGAQRTIDRGQKRLQGALVVAEISLAVVVVSGAALMVNTFIRLNQVKLGFDPQNVLAVQVPIPLETFQDRDKHVVFSRAVVTRLEAIPGVESAAWTDALPPSGVNFPTNFRLPGRQYADRQDMPEVNTRRASPGFFAMLRIPLIEGRVFEKQDVLRSTRQVVISRAMARMYWPQDSAIGQRILLQEQDETPAEVIGVVEDLRTRGLTGNVEPVMYVNPYQAAYPGYQVVMRTSVEPLSLVSAVKDAIREIEPDQTFPKVTTLEQHLASNLEYVRSRFYTALLGAFGALALLLAVIGLYGVLSFMVSRRSREIGLRMALGAQRGAVLRQVMADGLKLTALGLVIGVGVAVSAAEVLADFLFGITPTDAFTYLCVAIVLTLVSLVACYLPARRATRVDPMTALRYE